MPWGIMCHSGASRHQTWSIHASGDWINPLYSALYIQCLVLGLPQYETWTSWCTFSEGAPRVLRAGAVPYEERLRNGLSKCGAEIAPGGLEKSSPVSHSNGTTTLILLLCTPFLIKLHTNGCVICQSFILTALERRGHLMWMERQDISRPPCKGKSTAWGATVPYLDPWLLKLPHGGRHISTLHFLKGCRNFCCHIH